MKRRTVKVIVFLLLGAIVNVAVAWARGATANRWFAPQLVVTRLDNGTDWFVYRDESLAMTRIVLCVCGSPFNDLSGVATQQPPQNLFSTWSRIRVPILPSDSDFKIRTIAGSSVMSAPMQTIVDEALGWPFRSMWCGWGDPSVFSFGPSLSAPAPIVDGIELRRPDALGTGSSAIPYSPLWPGFAINTIIYAAVLWLVFCAGPGIVRRRVRRGRGQCLHCGYDLRGQVAVSENRCPECGKTSRQN